MQCPTCNVALVMSDRNGIEIDYCPNCRGVWLDRGELDKIIERSAAAPGFNGPAPQAQFQQQHQPMPQQRYQERRHYDHDDDDDDYYKKHHGHGDYHHGHHKKHKKEGFLGDLFDF